MAALVTLFQAVQTDARAEIDAFLAALKLESANVRLAELSEWYHFKTFWDAQAFEGNRVMLAQDLAQLMYDTRDISSLGALLRRYGLDLYTIGTSVHHARRSIKVQFNLSRHTSQVSFATYRHFLMAGMKGETELARQVCAYLLAMEEQGRVNEGIPKPRPALELLREGLFEVDKRVDVVEKDAKEAKVIAINAHHVALRTEQSLLDEKKARFKRAQKHLEGTHDAYIRGRLFEWTLWHCPCCKQRLTLAYGLPNSIEIDEVFPRSRGGNRTWDNVQGLCRTCNRLKGDADTRGEFLGHWDFRTAIVLSGCDDEQRKYNRRMNAKENPLDPWLFPDEGFALV